MKIKVIQVKSCIGRKENHVRVAKALGLGRIGKSRIHEDNLVIRGMINKISYMVKVEPVEVTE
ncbi:MAG TPA: 50S ribosomal protein L30 [Candidatus Cloacimonadota bacterium]|nr:50S ribosomal protein L30 [Candidatus Cloacimonadota bacterium]HPT71643.1 50S ribosomal protein L30 [Candidatus Cloacimonadota bacterium]